MGEAEDWMPATSGEESLLPEEWAEDWGWEDDTTSGSESEAAKTENHRGGSGAVGWTPGEDTDVSNVEISFKANLSEGALHELRTVLEACRAKY